MMQIARYVLSSAWSSDLPKIFLIRHIWQILRYDDFSLILREIIR